jgi:hypothetical protein
MVEFALVIPILIVLVVAVADFGRIFATSLSLEAAARNAAEVVANEYLSRPPGSDATPPVQLNQPAPPGQAAYYDNLRDIAVRTLCDETQELANSNYNSGTGLCAGMPLAMVCVHDSQDTQCGSEAMGAGVPAECTQMSTPPVNAHLGPRWVEVRTCYRFTSILALPLVSFGDIWLQRTRTFVIPCYFVLGDEECG